jgi:hypothetical protein
LELAQFLNRWPELWPAMRLAMQGFTQMTQLGFFDGVADLNRAREQAEKIADPSGTDATAREGARLVLMAAIMGEAEWDSTEGRFVGPLPNVAEAARRRSRKLMGRE